MAKRKVQKPLCLGDVVTLAGGRQAEWSREACGEHTGNTHFRTIDTLGTMLRNGTITAQMHNAGQDFAATFYLAQLSGPSAPSFDRISGGHWRESMTERVAFARKRITQAMEAVGGMGSPGGSAVWHVAGVGMTLKEWAALQGWNGRRLSPHEARGVLLAALGMLAMHYGYLQKT